MTVGPDGYTLVVATPLKNRWISYSADQQARGNLLVMDLRTLNRQSGTIDPPLVVSGTQNHSFSGKSPQVVTATKDPNRFLVANIADYAGGLGTLNIQRDPTTGKLRSAQMLRVSMSQHARATPCPRVERPKSATSDKGLYRAFGAEGCSPICTA